MMPATGALMLALFCGFGAVADERGATGRFDQELCGQLQRFVDGGWGFEIVNRSGEPAIVSVSANGVATEEEIGFLLSQHHLERLKIYKWRLRRRDLQQLARSCPQLLWLEVYGRDRGVPKERRLSAGFYHDLCRFKHLTCLRWLRVQFPTHGAEAGGFSGSVKTLTVAGPFSNRVGFLVDPHGLESLDLRFTEERPVLSDNDLNALNRQRTLTRLALRVNVPGPLLHCNFDRLSNLRQIRALLLEGCLLEPAKLRRFRNLEELVLRWCAFKKGTFREVVTLPSLKRVTLLDCSHLALGGKPPFVKEMSNLKSVTLELPQIDELKTFQRTPVKVDLRLGPFLRDDDGGHMWRASETSCAGMPIDRNVVDVIREIGRLRSVAWDSAWGKATAGEGLVLALAQHSEIQNLSLHGFQITAVESAEASEVMRPVNLTELSIESGVSIGASFVSRLVGETTTRLRLTPLAFGPGNRSDAGDVELKVPNLRRLELVEYGVDGPWELPRYLLHDQIEEIILQDCGVTSSEIELIAERCSELRRISLVGCFGEGMTQLNPLARLSSLKYVDVTGSRVPVDTVLNLRAPIIRFGAVAAPERVANE